MKPFKGLAIYPKIVEEKPLSKFTPEEKEHLTRTGFRWYVYYSYLNPHSGDYEKKIAPTLHLNRIHKDFNERYKGFHRLLDSTRELLEDGASPFDVAIHEGEVLTIDKAIDYALSVKKLKIGKDTYDSYEIRANQLKEFLKKRGLLHRDTFSFNFKVIREFLNDVAKKSSMANRNNVLRAIKALFSEMYKNDMITENYVAKIDIEKVHTQRFKSYSHQEAIDIIKHLEKVDPVMGLFIKFIGYNFLRPKEVVRLKVGDIDMDNKLLSVFVKQGRYKTKRIPESIIEELSKYDLSKKDNLLFCLNSISGKWKRDEKGRRQYYSAKYTEIKKKLGFGEGYVLYSFRHTYITIGYKNLRKRLSKEDSLDTLMGYTGHDSRESLQKYIHYTDAEIVGEYKGVVE